MGLTMGALHSKHNDVSFQRVHGADTSLEDEEYESAVSERSDSVLADKLRHDRR